MSLENRIGIFGGSFDPVHIGHLIVSIRAIEELELDTLYIVPAYRPPHKSSAELSPYSLRRQWLEKSFESVQNAVVSDYERERGDTSYSLYTVRHFASLHLCKPYLIVGEDSYRTLDTWYEYKRLLDEASLVVYPRFSSREELNNMEGTVFLSAPRIEISSTDIRSRVRLKKSVLGMVPDIILKEVSGYYE